MDTYDNSVLKDLGIFVLILFVAILVLVCLWYGLQALLDWRQERARERKANERQRAYDEEQARAKAATPISPAVLGLNPDQQFCDGTPTCRAPRHIHGCYADHDGYSCTDPGEHHSVDDIDGAIIEDAEAEEQQQPFWDSDHASQADAMARAREIVSTPPHATISKTDDGWSVFFEVD